jgi:hypothetical protein
MKIMILTIMIMKIMINEELHSPPKSPGISRPNILRTGSSCHDRGLGTNNVTKSTDADL